MSILKALQKKQAEQPNEVETVAAANVVAFEKNGRKANTPPEIFTETEQKIGSPKSSAFNGQSDSLIGKALPDLETVNSAGATLNAVQISQKAEDESLPEFASWSVEADRVEPRLVTITHPHSTYCEEYRNLLFFFIDKWKSEILK